MLVMALSSLFVVQPLAAQRRDSVRTPRSTSSQRGAAPRGTAANRADAAVVRAELAAVLLQSRRYDEAAREYRLLLAREPRSVTYRLGLARALAWGRRPREAEHELRVVRALRPNDREIEALLRSVRESLRPDSREAASWVAERPAHRPYRLALARALVREGKPRAALQHYDGLIAGDRSAALHREAASANRAAGQHVQAAVLLIGVLQRSPADTAVRHALASVLSSARRLDIALAHYDTLVARHPTPALLLERAQLNVTRRDLLAAEADANASNLARPNAGAYRLLGDLRRWRGDVAEARSAYNLARVLAPEDLAVAAAIAELERENRPVAGLSPSSHDAAGWQFHSSAVTDNSGMSYATAGARGDVQLLRGLAGSVDLAVRNFRQDTAGLDADKTAFAIGLGLSGGVARGPLLAQLGARGGLTSDGAEPIFMGGIGTTGWFGAWGLALELATGPAYPSLLTAGSIRPPRGEPLTERTIHAAIGGPLGHADVALSVERADISDGNRRSSVQAYVRHPVAPEISAVASANGIWFAERTSLYWDPIAYIAARAGFEYAVRQPRGFSFAARLLAGPARIDDEILRNRQTDNVRQHSLQLGGSIEVDYRTAARALGGAVTYGSGRTGEYRRLEASVHARLQR
jgi:tetratricopeptide (TPR) repeat protein